MKFIFVEVNKINIDKTQSTLYKYSVQKILFRFARVVCFNFLPAVTWKSGLYGFTKKRGGT
jgi:hypothetical protein